jgi:hypothetical protein
METNISTYQLFFHFTSISYLARKKLDDLFILLSHETVNTTSKERNQLKSHFSFHLIIIIFISFESHSSFCHQKFSIFFTLLRLIFFLLLFDKMQFIFIFVYVDIQFIPYIEVHFLVCSMIFFFKKFNSFLKPNYYYVFVA